MMNRPTPTPAMITASLEFQRPLDTRAATVRELLAQAALADAEAREMRKSAGQLIAALEAEGKPHGLDPETAARLVALHAGGTPKAMHGIMYPLPTLYKARR